MTDTAEAPTEPKAARTRRPTKKGLNEASAQASAPQQELNAVIIHRIEDPEGNLNVDVQTAGNVRVTEVETLLKLAARLIAGRLGVE